MCFYVRGDFKLLVVLGEDLVIIGLELWFGRIESSKLVIGGLGNKY